MYYGKITIFIDFVTTSFNSCLVGKIDRRSKNTDLDSAHSAPLRMRWIQIGLENPLA